MKFTVKAHKLQADGAAVDFVRAPHFGSTLPAPTKILVMHFTYGGSASSSARWFQDPRNTSKASAHLVIDRDGSAIQCVPLNVAANHAGRSRLRNIVGLNPHSIGIELANWGYLRSSGDGWESYTDVKIANPVMAEHVNGNPNGVKGRIGWEPYRPVQFANAVAIAQLLVATYGIEEIVGHDQIAPGRKWDPGPAFDMDRFRAQVLGRHDDDGDIRRTVAAPDGLNLRSGPGVQFPASRLLPQGTVVEPIERDGHWMSVSVIAANNGATATGWVHERYLD